MPVELVLITLPFLAIAVLFYFTVVVENKVESKTDNPDVVVDVTAFQWNWKFGYDKIRQDDGSYKNHAVQGSPSTCRHSARVEHGHELPLPAGGRSDDIRDYLKFSKIETRYSHRSGSWSRRSASALSSISLGRRRAPSGCPSSCQA